MSFGQRVLLLGGIFVILLAALGIGAFTSPQSASRRASQRLLLPGLQPDAVSRVVVRDASSQVSLTRASHGWTIDLSGAAFPASSERVDALVGGVAALTSGTLITEDPSKAASLGLEGARAIVVQLFGAQGQALADLTAGNRGAGGSGYYMRVGTNRQVWQTGADVSAYLTAERTFWEDLRVLPRDLTVQAVVRISETRPAAKGSSWTLSRGPDSRGTPRWSFADSGDTVQASKADSVATALLGLEGEDFLTAADARSAVASPAAVVTVSFNDGRDFSLSFGARTGDDRYPCALRGGAVVYLVPQWRYEQIVVDPAALRAPSRGAGP